MPITRVLVLAALLGGLAGPSLANPTGTKDVGGKPPAPPASASIDRGARCAPTAVNECRDACGKKRFEVKPPRTLGDLQNECRLDCVRGC